MQSTALNVMIFSSYAFEHSNVKLVQIELTDRLILRGLILFLEISTLRLRFELRFAKWKISKKSSGVS